MKDVFEREYFFNDGIRFGCVQCGCCCTGEPGIVKVSWGELDLIAHTLGVGVKKLLDDGVVVPYEAAYRLQEDPQNGNCVFFCKQRLSYL